jgi:hypothetical protein
LIRALPVNMKEHESTVEMTHKGDPYRQLRNVVSFHIEFIHVDAIAE